MLFKDATQHIMGPALASRENGRKLRFTANGTFQVSIFSDLHFAESIHLPDIEQLRDTNSLTISDATLDSMTQVVMSDVLESEKPQLVVLNGDLISGEAVDGSNPGQYLPHVVKPLVDKNTLWASTYGNHDSDVNLDPMQDIYNHEIKYQNSLTTSMISSTKAGITNYYLPVYPYDGANDTPSLILWFFDSRGGHYSTGRGKSTASGTRGDWVDKDVRLLP